MTKKIAINGFGRIGRNCLKIILDNFKDLEVVAINDLTDSAMLAHLLQYDSVYGEYKEVSFDKEGIIVNGKKIRIYNEKEPENLPWKELKVDVVLECTGIFTKKEGASKHLLAGAKKVIISAPAKSDDIPSYILGVNADKYKGEEIIDMGSCTTNCLAPVVKVLEDAFQIEKGFVTTTHSYTLNQNLLDGTNKDFRRARAAAINIVPTTTGAAKAISKVIPTMEGKLDGVALRVPTATVSIVDLVCLLKKETTKEEVNALFENYKEKSILKLEKKPLVSSDFIKNTHSSIVDAEMTKVNGKLVQILSWYDNEWGYSFRLAELAQLI
ncbi:MAG: type I glyceraldehyde-3-phosphate dehydrogenase [Candidatus Pacebacteria bacterium]|nr:type I glyceraldehyde-3-phosphate dehydrogenase [Candidatus Paceibacterota bacterium]MDD4333722.1 type I glyceraldehyde-3-phosphate dehydrogenase [Candidatus Paceibacterota bacterium]